jgi:membrane dipeptidase
MARHGATGGSVLIDLHCDTLSKLVNSGYSLRRNPFHFDIDRALEVGVTAQFLALFSHNQDDNAVLRAILQQIACFRTNLSGPVKARAIAGYEDLARARAGDEMALILHLEGADALGQDPGLWPLFHHMGVRSLGLTWNYNNAFAGGVLDPDPAGLSSAGQRLLNEMEAVGSILDLAHVGEASYYQALEQYSPAVMVSHANARSICDHPRNLSDHQIMTLAEHGGIIGVNLVPDFVDTSNPNLNRLLDHIDYISSLVGVEHVALGSDFDGADELLLSGVEDYALLAAGLNGRGFTHQEVEAILHDNAAVFLSKVFAA